MALVSLIYISTACTKMSNDGAHQLLRQSVSNNKTLGISGLLLYSSENGAFFQILEGEAQAIDYLFARIKNDHRHTNIHCIQRKKIPQRNFSKWHMEFKAINNETMALIPGYTNIDCETESQTLVATMNLMGENLFQHFKKEYQNLVY